MSFFLHIDSTLLRKTTTSSTTKRFQIWKPWPPSKVWQSDWSTGPPMFAQPERHWLVSWWAAPVKVQPASSLSQAPRWWKPCRSTPPIPAWPDPTCSPSWCPWPPTRPPLSTGGPTVELCHRFFTSEIVCKQLIPTWSERLWEGYDMSGGAHRQGIWAGLNPQRMRL